MNGGDHSASVRIELDDATPTGPGPSPSGPQRGRRPILVVAVVAALVSVGLVVLALPDGDAAAPEAAASTTTSTSTVPPSTTTEAASAPSGLSRTDLRGEVVSIVPAERGWIALTSQTSRSGPPTLHRSLDGIAWTQIETTVDVPVVEDSIRDYSNLIETDTGFALLMMTTTDPGPTSEDSTVRVDRLVSAFGVEWRVDPSFEPIERVGLFVQPTVHTGGYAQIAAWSDEVIAQNSLFAEVLRSTVADPAVLPEAICWAFDAGERIEVMDCSGPPAVSLEADAFAAPDRFDRIRQCVNVLVASIGRLLIGFEFTVVGPGAPERTVRDVAQLVTSPAVLADGTLVLVDAGSDLLDEGVCAELVESDHGLGPSLVVWPTDAPEAARIPIDLGGFVGRPFGPTTTAARTPDGVRVLVGSGVWDVDADLTIATSRLSLDEPAGVVLIDDGATVLQVDDGLVEVIDVVTGERAVLARDVGPVARAVPMLVSADGGLLFVAVDGGSLAVVELDAG